ncbi:MAG: phytanoyl-CoA dioxygenase family protein [Acidobacteria bacterium]|nr:phytanoyl-CoA dioxygenase family protein [Acidobacteriota bacterium]
MINEALKQNFQYRLLSDDQLRDYAENGYHCYGPILTASGLAEMRRQCMAAWEAEKSAFDASKTWLENALLVNIHHKASIVRDYYFEGPLVDVARQIIGLNIKAATSQLTFKMKGNTRPFLWHQDNGYGELDPYNAISCLTALDDTDQENGCLWLVPGSNREGQRRHEQQQKAVDATYKVELRTEVAESKAIPVPMKAGECLFFSCWTLHKSEGNLSNRDRRILFFRYADADAVEVYNDQNPRLGRLLRGTTRFEEVRRFECEL